MNIEWIRWVSYADAAVVLILSALAGIGVRNGEKEQDNQILKYIAITLGIFSFLALRLAFGDESIMDVALELLLLIFGSCLLFFVGLTI